MAFGPALLAMDLLPHLVESAFVLSLVIVTIVLKVQRLTAVQFFWLAAVLLCIFFLVTMLLYMKYA
jgi:hypothetical protein